MPDDFETLSQLNELIDIAESEGSRGFLDGVLAEVMAFRRANGQCVDRTAFLNNVKAGGLRETEIESIAILGHDRAIVTCVVSMDIEEQRRRFRNVRLFVRSEDNQWKLLGWANEPA
jgi:Domain of unknown function (DUF4440)